MSTIMSINELNVILAVCAGSDPETLEQDSATASFEELGYDSLVLLETSAVLKRDYGVNIPDDEMGEARTPGELLDKINACELPEGK
jgi:minimal PKS acyl carrier protein